MGKKKYITTDSPDFPKNIDIDKLTDEEFIKFAKLLYESDGCLSGVCNSRSCSKCPWDRHSYVGNLINVSCSEIATAINKRFCDLMFKQPNIKMIGKEKSPISRPKEQTCIYCKYYHRELGEDGYKFCKWWHNFTRSDGYCYAFAQKKESV